MDEQILPRNQVEPSEKHSTISAAEAKKEGANCWYLPRTKLATSESFGKTDMWANRTLLQEKWPQFDGQVATSKLTAGLLMYRLVGNDVQLLLVHPGGPYLRGHDLGTWTIPQGEIKPDEAVLNAACCRFTEEVGLPAFGPFIPLRPAHQRSGSIVYGWAFAAAGEVAELQVAAEERAEWFTPQAAKFRIDPAQAYWIDELIAQLPARS